MSSIRFSGSGGGGGGPTELLVEFATVALPNGDFVAKRINIGPDETLRVLEAGVQDNNNTAPDDLTAKVRDETGQNTEYTGNSKKDTGDPLLEMEGEVDISFRLDNQTGAEQFVSGHFVIQIE